MPGKLGNLLDPMWRTFILWLLAAFKSTELVRGLFRGTEAWFDQSVTMLLFFATCVLASRLDIASNRAVRKVRIGLVIMLALSLVWSTLRTTHNALTERIEHDRLVRIHEQMKESEAHRLGPIYRRYRRAAKQLLCDTAAPVDRRRCADLVRRIADIARFRLAQPEQSDSADTLRAALCARQEEFRRILFEAHLVSKRLPKPVDFEIARMQHGYWEMMQWMRENPTRIEVQAVAGGLMSHGLVLTIAMLLASVLDLVKPAGAPPTSAPGQVPPSVTATEGQEAPPPESRPEMARPA